MNTLQKTLKVPIVPTRTLDLSNLRYAIVCDNENVTALFRWSDRAKKYAEAHSVSRGVLDLETGEIIR